MEEIFIRRPGSSLLRVRVVRVKRTRLRRIAKAMRGAGWGLGRIAEALRLDGARVTALLQTE